MATTITKTEINEIIKEILSEQQFLDPKIKRNGKDPQIQNALQIESKVFTDVVKTIEKARVKIENLLVGKTVSVTPETGFGDPFKGKVKAVKVFTDENEMSFDVVVGVKRYPLSQIS